jgi:mannose-6-phosphate isomerase-like protein (cupin superfamily)
MRSCDQVAVPADGVPIHYEPHGSGSPASSSRCNANSCQQAEGEIESGTPSIIDLNAELAKLTMFRGRTPRSTMADRKGSGARLAAFRDGALFTTKFAGKGHWESHLTGDELIHILDGTATLQIVGEDGPQSFALRAGTIAVIPQGAWHRFQSPEGVTLMTATPSPSEVIEIDVDDPRTVERKPA